MSDKEWWEKPYTDTDWENFKKNQAEFEANIMKMVNEAEKNRESLWLQNQAAMILGLHSKRLTYLDENREIMHPAHIKEMEYSTEVTRRLLRNIIKAANRIGITGPFIPAIIREDLEKYK